MENINFWIGSSTAHLCAGFEGKSLTMTASTALGIRRDNQLSLNRVVKKRHIKSSSNKKWFDKECRLKRHELRKLANLKHSVPLNVTLREGYHTVLTETVQKPSDTEEK